LANNSAFLAAWVRLLGLGCLIATGCTAAPPRVIVIGGGPAGMAAAIAASDRASVVLLEGESVLGGSARYGEAITAVGGGMGLPDDFAERVQEEVVDWTGEMGLRWVPVPDPGGGRAHLMHPEGGGRALSEAMALAVVAAGVEVRLDTRVTDLIRADPWRIMLTDGATLEADTVVVATGGFLGAIARARLSLGQPELLRSAPEFADGAGEDWLVAAGGVVPLERRALIYAHAVQHPQYPERALMVVEAPGAFIIDSEGRVLGRSLSPRGGVNAKAAAQFLWVDSVGLAHVQFFDPLDSAPHDARSVFEQGGWMAPDASMAAIALVRTPAKSLSGVITDQHARVLNSAGRPIAGLLAAGEVAGFGGGAHPAVDNTMVASAILSGRLAAATAAAGEVN
jgi:predicted oxidoreductase